MKRAAVGVFLLVVPMALTLLLTGRNEDRVPQAAVAVPTAENRDSQDTEPSEPKPLPSESPKPEEPSEPVEPVPPPEPSKPAPPRPRPSLPAVPVFAGFEQARFQMHDALIARCVAAFNANPAQWAGATAEQAKKVSRISAEQVKAQMIQESGGQNALSRAAWKKDPLQVNVPGDWNSYKKYLGLHRPRNRNEGSLETNLKAGIMMLVRKGFGESGQPAANRPGGSFDGWRPALQRYNGRKDLTTEGVPYRVAYANRILNRAASPRVRTDIEIRKK